MKSDADNGTTHDISIGEYRSLADLRHHIRRFLSFSEQAARAADLEPQQHQLMLAIKGLPADAEATIGELAYRLQLQHHSTVELVNRLEQRELVYRRRGEADRRQVFVHLTAHGEEILRELSVAHWAELRLGGPALVHAIEAIIGSAREGAARERETHSE